MKTNILTLGAAAAVTAWGIVGVFGPKSGFTDALFEPDYTIQHIWPGGPLDEAGFQVGDSVVSVEGIPVADLGMYSRWPKELSRQPGEHLTLTVNRDGRLVDGRVVFRERPESSKKLQAGGLFVGLSFLWCGVWAFLFSPASHGTTLLAMGLALGIALPGPDAGSWNGVRDHLQQAGMVLWALLLLRFFLTYPRRKGWTEGHLPDLLLFLPWIILLVCLALELIFHPRFYHSFGSYYGGLILVYLLLALVAALHTVFRLPREEIRASGFGLILSAGALTLGSLLVWALDLFSLISIPWANSIPLVICVIPLALAVAVRKGAAPFSDM